MESIYVFKQAVLDGCPHRIQYKINTFASGVLGCGNKITVSSNQNDLVHVLLIRKGSNIKAYFISTPFC